jgi:hypothetical protein
MLFREKIKSMVSATGVPDLFISSLKVEDSESNEDVCPGECFLCGKPTDLLFSWDTETLAIIPPSGYRSVSGLFCSVRHCIAFEAGRIERLKVMAEVPLTES